MKRRTEPALYLHPSGNDQGEGYFMKIDNGERVHTVETDVLSSRCLRKQLMQFTNWQNNKNI